VKQRDKKKNFSQDMRAKVRIMIPMYQPLKTSKCKKCGKILTEPNTFIRIFQGKIEYWKETQ